MNTYGSKNLHKCHPLQSPSWGWAAGSVGTRACRVDHETEPAEQSFISELSCISSNGSWALSAWVENGVLLGAQSPDNVSLYICSRRADRSYSEQQRERIPSPLSPPSAAAVASWAPRFPGVSSTREFARSSFQACGGGRPLPGQSCITAQRVLQCQGQRLSMVPAVFWVGNAPREACPTHCKVGSVSVVYCCVRRTTHSAG